MGRVKLQIKKIENTTNRQHIRKLLRKLKVETDQIGQVPSPMVKDSQLKEVQREILICKTQLEEMKNRLRAFEGDPSEITTLYEAEYREQVLQETLQRVQLRKCFLEEEHISHASPQVHLTKTVDVDGFVAGTTENALGWFPQGDTTDQILNFVNAYGPNPLSDQQSMSTIVNMVTPTSTLMHSANINHDFQISPGDGTKADINNTLNTQFGQVTDNNLSSWEHLHHLESAALSVADTREGQLLEQYLSQVAMTNVFMSNQDQLQT
ncbi:hypothetical protein P8452_23276 [Trifolium repens]|nr:hypothetical protein P8452_23276 [Trifolium repens]